MPWSSTVDAEHTIPGGTRIVVETRDLFLGTTFIGQQRRSNELTTTRIIGLTKAGADAYFGSYKTASGVEDLVVERADDSGQHVVVRVDITYGTWA